MSKETIKMRELRIQRIALKKALRETEQSVSAHRVTISELWPHRDTNKEAFKGMKKHCRAVKKEKEALKVYRAMLRTTKDEIKRLNRQHDIHVNAIAEHKKYIEEKYPKTSLLG